MALIAFCLAFLGLSAQQRQYIFERVQGVYMQPPTYHLTTDEYGRLWFGTWGRGAFCYDGYNFTRYQSDSDNPNSLSNDRIFAVACDNRQRVWMGSIAGLNCLDRRTGQIRRFQALGDSIFQFPVVYADRQGGIWAAPGKAILRYDEEKGAFAAVPSAGTSRPSRAGMFYEDAAGVLWCGRYDGLLRFAPDRRSYTSFSIPKKQAGDADFRVMSILEDRLGHFWIAGFEGLLLYDRTTGRVSRPALPDSLAFRHITAMIEGPDGKVWLAFAKHGLLEWDVQTNQCQHFTNNPLDPASLPEDEVLAMTLDRFGNLWLGLPEGLARINLLPQPFTFWLMNASNPADKHNTIIRLAQDDRGGILVRSQDQLFYLEKFGATPWPIALEASKGKQAFEPDDFFTDRSHQVWAIYNGLFCWEPANRRFHRFPTPLQQERIVSMEQDAEEENVFWLGTLKGLNRFDRRSGEVRLFTDIAPKGQSRTAAKIVDDGHGALWLDVSGALTRFDKKTAGAEVFTSASAPPHRLVNDEILDLQRGPDGSIWATTTGGITIVNPLDGTFQNLTRHNGLPDNVVITTLFDAQGNAWLSAPEQILRRDVASGALRTFNTAAALQTGQWTRGRCQLSDGRLLFAARHGLILIDPTQVTAAASVAPLLLMRRLDVREQTARTDTLPEFIRHFQLPYSDNDLSFEWVGVQTEHPGELAYACKMEGFDADWVWKGAERKATYTNLPHGRYTFKVKTLGIEDAPELAVILVIAPPWWQSAWFRMMIVVLLGAAVYLFVREREAQRRLRQQKELAEQNARYKTRFLANMSHEIRTPMNAILGLSRLLTESQLPPKQGEYADAIRQSSENLLVIVNDVLDQVKIESGKFRFQQKPFDLALIIKHLENTLGFKAEEKGLQFEIKMAEGLPTQLVGDPVRLNQILTNLLGNAIKFTERGFVRLRVEFETKRPPSTFYPPPSTLHPLPSAPYRFVVEDSGIGISPEKMERVFESFQQADDDIAAVYGGTGLGLSITRQLVEQQGGTIALDSLSGAGTTVTVTLPFQTNAPATTSVAEPAKKAPAFKDLKILLVEDTLFNQMLATELLKSRIPGVDIELAENGQVALEKLQSTESEGFDLVLMDVKMPVLDGLEATRRLRAQQIPARNSRALLPIIALTANAVPAELDKCRDAGMDAWVTKPIDAEELFMTMGRVLKGRI